MGRVIYLSKFSSDVSLFFCENGFEQNSRSVIVKHNSKTRSAVLLRRFCYMNIPNKISTHQLVKKFKLTGSLCDRKHIQKCTVWNEETIDVVISPISNMFFLLKHMFSKNEQNKATQLLYLNQYKILVSQKFLPDYYAAKPCYCQRFNLLIWEIVESFWWNILLI